MDSTTPQTPYDLDTRLLTINKLAKTAQSRGRWLDADRLFELAFKLLDPNKEAKPSNPAKVDTQEDSRSDEYEIEPCGNKDCLICDPTRGTKKELPKVCGDPGCGICHPWNKEVE